MDNYITLEAVANIVTLVIPGYVASRTYAAVYAKGDKDFSRVLIESVALSLPILGAFNLLWKLAPGDQRSPTSSAYVLLLLAFSIVLGLLGAWLRRQTRVKQVIRKLSLPAPDEDFIRNQFSKLTRNEAVTVTLQNGDIFSGTPQGGSILKDGASRQYYFNNIAWYDKETKAWDVRTGSIVIDLGHVEYIETERRLPKD
jgi:hypothetical protein